jgi:hypothetical protein
VELKLLQIAEYAALTAENKLILAGTFDSFDITRPVGTDERAIAGLLLPPFYLVAVLECSLAEGTRHRALLRVLDDDGKAVVEGFDLGEVQFIVNKHGRPMRYIAILAMRGFAVPRPGEFAIELHVNGNRLGTVMLYVTDITGTK